MKAGPVIFLNYAHQDVEPVESLYQKLRQEGFKPWMDKHDILPGEDWALAIKRAVRGCDFFLVCLSSNSVDRRGVLQKEIKMALDLWQGMLGSDIFLIPVRLEKCKVPESLEGFQWVDLFEQDGWEKLLRAIEEGLKRRI